jgi:hypothetical protein
MTKATSSARRKVIIEVLGGVAQVTHSPADVAVQIIDHDVPAVIVPPDPEGMNDDRAEWAGAAIRHFQCTTGTDWEDTVADLLCDLMHFCDRESFDFQKELDRARMHYEAETTEGGAA